MDLWRKLDLGNQADPITRRCNAVRLRQAESKVWNLDILADFFGSSGKSFSITLFGVNRSSSFRSKNFSRITPLTST